MHKWLVAFLLVLSLQIKAQNPLESKREQYLEIGTGLATLGDYVWDSNSDFPSIRPSYGGFILRNKSTNAKALPLIITYRAETNTKRWYWYTNLILEFARKRTNTDSNYTIKSQSTYSNVWGFEFQYIKRKQFCMSLKFGAGVMVYHFQEQSGGIFYSDPFNISSGSENPIGVFPFPTFEFQPFCFRFGNKDAMYVNLSLGTTGFIQLGYSKKW